MNIYQDSMTKNTTRAGAMTPELDVPAKPADRQTVPSTRVWSADEVKSALESITSDAENARALKAVLNQMLAHGETSTLQRVENPGAFDMLERDCGNFSEVVAAVRRQVTLSQDGVGYPLVRPLLLLGRPGVGKSYFAQRLAETLGTSLRHMDMASTSASFVLCGSARQWGDAAEGLIARELIGASHANPVFVLDEIDKAGVSQKFSAVAPLYTLLEPSTSSRFRDEFLQIEMNARHIVWVMTANVAADIPDPLLSRMDVFEIEPPSLEDMQWLARSVYGETRKSSGAIHFEQEVEASVLLPLVGRSVREMRRVIETAMARTNELGYRRITRSDIEAAMASIYRPVKSRIGFL
jgi:ATP-dependent Lon protease